MLVDPDSVAQKLAGIYAQEFDGKTSGRYCITKKNLSVLAGSGRLERNTVNRIIEAVFKSHSLLLIPLDGSLAKAKSFGVMKKEPSWRTVPDKVARVIAREP